MRPVKRLSQDWHRESPRSRTGVAAVAALSLLIGGACVERDDEKPTEEDMKAIEANILSAPPTPKFPVNADLEGKVVYVGVDIDPATAVPGKELKLVHYWKTVTPPGEGWRVFTHITGPNGQGFINADHGPVGGKYAVSQWKAGQIIRDEHTITLPANWAHASLIVYTGLWRGPTRLAITTGPNDGSNRIIAATVPVQVAPRAEVPRKRYVARRTDKPVKIDGKLDEAAWKDAPSTGPFVNTMNGGPAEQATEAKMLWDDKFLYVAFENADSDAWSNLSKRDDKLWTQEAVELMIDADKNGKTYVEFQVAPNGAVFDTYLPTYRKYEDSIDPKKAPYSWNSKINAKVVVNGTLNKHDDKDKGWTVELALPLVDVKGMAPDAEISRLPPGLGDTWRINMFRMDVPQGKPQQAVGWSPPLVGDFHALDKFGDLVFGDDKGNMAPMAAMVPPVPPVGGKVATKSGAGDADKAADKKAARAKRKAEKAQKAGDKASP